MIIEYNPKQDSYIIMTENGNKLERLDMQVDMILRCKERDEEA